MAGRFLLQPPKVLGWHPGLQNPTPHVCFGLLLPLLQGWGALGMGEAEWGTGEGGRQLQEAEAQWEAAAPALTPSLAPRTKEGGELESYPNM